MFKETAARRQHVLASKSVLPRMKIAMSPMIIGGIGAEVLVREEHHSPAVALARTVERVPDPRPNVDRASPGRSA